MTNVLTHVKECTHDEARWLTTHLSIEDNRNLFYTNWRGESVRRDDGGQTLKLLNTVTKTFPSGLTRGVIKAGRYAGERIEFADKRVRPCDPDGSTDISWLYDFQAEIVVKCCQQTRGVVESPTGSGKTEMMIALVKSIPCRWILLVDDKDLVHNAARRYEQRTGESAGVVGDGLWDVEGHRFVCATFQSILSRLNNDRSGKLKEWLASFGGLLVDECHISAAPTYYQIVTTIDAYWRFGFSGTPLDRSDRMGAFTIGCLGDLIEVVDTGLLIDRKIISRPIIEMHELDQESRSSTYKGAYSDLIVKSVARNNLLADLAMDGPFPILAFVQYKKHGEDLAKRLKKRGLVVQYIDGSSNTSQRDRTVEELEWGDLQAVVVTKMWQKGKDIPSIGTVLIAAAPKSVISILQSMGRGMRVVRDGQGHTIKDTVRVIDVLDRGNKWLQRHALARLRTYKSKTGYEVEVIRGRT